MATLPGARSGDRTAPRPTSRCDALQRVATRLDTRPRKHRLLVPGVGIEPTWPYGRGILSPLRLPVSPSGPGSWCPNGRANRNPGRSRDSCRCNWRPRSELNRRTRICSPLHNHSATRPIAAGLFHIACGAACRETGLLKNKPRQAGVREPGAGNETRTRDPDLGKVVLYQLSYSRNEPAILLSVAGVSTAARSSMRSTGHAARRYS